MRSLIRQQHPELTQSQSKNQSDPFSRIADYTRWDKTEAGIKQIHDFLDNLDEDDYFYILIGENIGDEESQGNPELRDEWGLFPVWGLDTTGFK